jgi:hypothetical protein
MKKIITIGDLHGNNIWKQMGDINELLNSDNIIPKYDYYIFVGDYCDSFDKTTDEILDNLNDIIKIKLLYPDNVILLWGNHEMFYLLDLPWGKSNKHYCSGNRSEIHYFLYEFFNKHYNLFQFSFQYKNYLWTHAGVHCGWYMKFKKEFDILVKKWDLNLSETLNLSEKLNIAFDKKLDCIFDVGHRRGGFKNVGGPLWLDKELMYKKPLNNYHQIVGHTHIKDIRKFEINNNTSVTFIDVLNDNNKSFLLLNIKN